MEEKFEKGRTYLCSSISGVTPSFQEKRPIGSYTIGEKDNKDVSASLWDYLRNCVKVVIEGTDGNRYPYSKNVSTFRPGAEYTCLSEEPLVLKGERYVPFLEQRDEESVFGKFFESHGIKADNATIEAFADHYEWKLEHWWDGTEEGLKELVMDELKAFGKSYAGSHNGYVSDQRACALQLYTFFGSDTARAWIHLRENYQLPQEMEISWEDGEGRPSVTANGLPFLHWVSEMLSPMEVESHEESMER